MQCFTLAVELPQDNKDIVCMHVEEKKEVRTKRINERENESDRENVGSWKVEVVTLSKSMKLYLQK